MQERVLKFVAFAILFVACQCTQALAGSTVHIGDPANPAGLQSEFDAAYSKGASTIIVKPGYYSFPAATTLHLSNWKDTTISCYGCMFMVNDTTGGHVFWGVSHCENLTLQGLTMSCAAMPMSESPIISLGPVDAKGFQTYNVRTPAGYPALPISASVFLGVVDGVKHQFKANTGDCLHSRVILNPDGTFNCDFNQKCPPLSLGDLIVARNPVPWKFNFTYCVACTIKDVTLYHNGFTTIHENDGKGIVFDHVIWAPGPPPAGGAQLSVFCSGSDGSDCINDVVGPTYRNCQWLGLLDDDDIAIHGFFWKVIDASGHTVTFKDNTRYDGLILNVGQHLRILSNTFFVQGTIMAIKDDTKETTVTLDHECNIPPGCYAYNPDACGAGYKIINCVLGSSRSRGIIAKADNGLIEGNSIYNAAVAAIKIGNDGLSGESGYGSNLVVRNNIINGNGQSTGGVDGAIHIGAGDLKQNKNIVIEGNVIIGPALSCFLFEGADGITIANNTLVNTAQDATRDTCIMWLRSCDNVSLTNNLLINPGPRSSTPWYTLYSNCNNVTGLDSTGLATASDTFGQHAH